MKLCAHVEGAGAAMRLGTVIAAGVAIVVALDKLL